MLPAARSGILTTQLTPHAVERGESTRLLLGGRELAAEICRRVGHGSFHGLTCVIEGGFVRHLEIRAAEAHVVFELDLRADHRPGYVVVAAAAGQRGLLDLKGA